MKNRKIRAAFAAITLGTLVLGACGSDDAGSGAAETGEDATTTVAAEESSTTIAEVAEATTTTAGEVDGQEAATPISEELTSFDVTAADYSYTGLDAGAQVPAGLVQINLTNEGAEEHQATLVRLHDGTTIDDFAAAGANDPTGAAALALVDGYGGPNGAAPQGGTSSAISNLVPGEYIMICFIPSPSDGVPHAAKGMLTPFAVTERPTDTGAADTSLADEELAGTITTEEFSFAVSNRAGDSVDTLAPGTYRLRNEGAQSHEAAIYRIAEGSSANDVLDFLGSATPAGPPPFEPAGGVAATIGSNSVSNYFEIDLDSGNYVLLCFLPDVDSDGAPHFVHGMVLPFSVQ